MRAVVLDHFIRANVFVDLHLRTNPFARHEPLIERRGARRPATNPAAQLDLQIALVVDVQLLHQRRQLVLFEWLPQVLFDLRHILRRHGAAKLVVQQLAIHHRGDLFLHQLLPHRFELVLRHLLDPPALLLIRPPTCGSRATAPRKPARSDRRPAQSPGSLRDSRCPLQ